jgi:protein TonB
MSAAVIFKDLPATFPNEDKYRKPSVVGSLLFHGLLITAVLIIPLMLPQSISERELLVTLVAPIGPPPPPPPPYVELPAMASQPVAKPSIRPVAEEVLVLPVTIPKTVVRIIEEPAVVPVGVIGGVPGGVPGGTLGGVLGGILSSNANAILPLSPPPPPPVETAAPPPPPPRAPAPAEPVRVGGYVREPRAIRMVPPVYPPLARSARVSGVVVLEATLTEQGTVDAIRVVSGHPLLIEAAIACVKQWLYEPTLLNGVPVSVILQAKVRFERAPVS